MVLYWLLLVVATYPGVFASIALKVFPPAPPKLSLFSKSESCVSDSFSIDLSALPSLNSTVLLNKEV